MTIIECAVLFFVSSADRSIAIQDAKVKSTRMIMICLQGTYVLMF